MSTIGAESEARSVSGQVTLPIILWPVREREAGGGKEVAVGAVLNSIFGPT